MSKSKVVTYEVSVADTETAWGIHAAMNEILLNIRAKLRADMLSNKLPVTYTVTIERE